jgi:fucose permease
VILFFTAAGAALGPLAMGAVSDAFGHNAIAGFILATVFAALLLGATTANLIMNPTKSRLQKLDESEY